MKYYFLGIDIGTQGARVVLIDHTGAVISSKEESFPLSDHSREEQSPDLWWRSCLQSIKNLLNEVRGGIDLQAIMAVSVTSTSGTIIPIDRNNEPLHPAIMYSDGRSVEAARLCTQVARSEQREGYTSFNTSSGLAKMVWFVQQYPEKAAKLFKFIHAADFIIGKLSGNFNTTDYTNALKSGYDVHQNRWPSYIWQKLPLQQEWLQEVVPSGRPVGTVVPELAAELGLSSLLKVVSSMTDGCASQIASGAVSPGDWTTTIGTTMVVKGVTTKAVEDPEGRLYSHRHPEGFWMPGGASNTGADWVTRLFHTDLGLLNERASHMIPTNHIAYPLIQKGERFPFVAPHAEGFWPKEIDDAALFASCMEGVAYLERYAYEMIEELSGEQVHAVYTAGGGSNSDTWLVIRANVLNRPVYKMKHTSGAIGAAVLAASKTYYGSINEAAKALTKKERDIYPSKEMAVLYELNYQKFKNILLNKGYIRQHHYA